MCLLYLCVRCYSTVDPYGFERPEDYDFQTYEEFMSHYLSVLTHRAQQWSSMLDGQKSAVSRSRKCKCYNLPTWIGTSR